MLCDKSQCHPHSDLGISANLREECPLELQEGPGEVGIERLDDNLGSPGNFRCRHSLRLRTKAPGPMGLD